MARLFRVGAALAVGAGVSLSGSIAFAEGPAVAGKSQAAAAPAPTDIVRLKNGGLVRGTISELVPGDSVTIVTLTGEARKFPMGDVTYAGAASGDQGSVVTAPPATAASPTAPATLPAADRPAGYVTVDAQAAHLHLVSDPPGLVFARQAVSSRGLMAYDRLCVAPCDITLPAGSETLSVGAAGEKPDEIANVSFPPGRSEIRATRVSKQSTRNLGWLVMGGGLASGIAIIAVGNKSNALKTVGWLVGLGGLGVGIGLVLVSDKTTIERVAGSVPPPGGERHATLVPALHGTF